MARKKSHKKSTTRRRRRVGAMALNAKSPLLMYGSIAAGYLLSDTIEGFVPDTLLATNANRDKIIGGATAGIGAALVFAKLGKKPKGALEVGLGGVLMGAGIKKSLKAFGVISGIGGYQSVPVIGNNIKRGINGYQSVPVIGYTPQRQALNGMPSMSTGYATRSTANQIMGNVDGGSGYNPHN